jgi:uncharacterized SAM-binding protein YcdF (DUF218 family)
MPWDHPSLEQPLAVVWDYMRLVHEPAPSDAILVLGSFDVTAAVWAAALWRAKWAPIIVMSGGVAHKGELVETGWTRPEAQVFADVAADHGVPRDAILLEDRAENTGQNFAYTRTLVDGLGLKIERLLVVAKPYMTRRGFATGRVVWPEIELNMQCEDISATDYISRDPYPDRVVHTMVGDLHRIIAYPALGFQIEQPWPDSVRAAMLSLVAAGFGSRLLPNTAY